MVRKIFAAFTIFCFTFTLLIGETLTLLAQTDAQAKPRIAVLPFSDTNANSKREGYGEAISGMLMTELINGKIFQVIERNEIQRMMEEMALQISGAVDSNTAKRIGEILGVEILVFGTVAKFGDLVETDIRLIDTETGEALLAESASSRSVEEIRSMVKNLARKIETRYLGRFLEELRITSTPAEATVYIDGTVIGQTPIVHNLNKGHHKVIVLKRGYENWEKIITVVKGANDLHAELTSTTTPPTPPYQPRPKSGGGNTLLYILGGAALVGGGAYFLLSQSKEEEKKSQVSITVTIP
ncbi:PEGA domain-containing protein [candidate division KSB1 bacterium]|nr:PEGA domain-containing protein [candidate division KSB1 bacterium]